MIDQHAWILVKLTFVSADLCVFVGNRLGRFSAWARRNSNRVVTLMFGAAALIESDWKRWNTFVFLMGLLLWNRPKDDEPPRRRRRREQERKQEELPPNWSGVPENA